MRKISQSGHAAHASAVDRRRFGSGGGRVLELGCGLGVAGIAAAMCGCSVLLTDTHGCALSACEDAIRINAERLKSSSSARAFVNGGRLQSVDEFVKVTEASSRIGQAFTMHLDWTDIPDLAPHERFSCIIAADVIHEVQHAPLISMVIRVRCH
jgi:ribosomal protein L11 methylase PrmA